MIQIINIDSVFLVDLIEYLSERSIDDKENRKTAAVNRW